MFLYVLSLRLSLQLSLRLAVPFGVALIGGKLFNSPLCYLYVDSPSPNFSFTIISSTVSSSIA